MRQPQNEVVSGGDALETEAPHRIPPQQNRRGGGSNRGGSGRPSCPGYASAAAIILCLSGPSSEAFVAQTQTSQSRTASARSSVAGLWSGGHGGSGHAVAVLRAGNDLDNGDSSSASGGGGSSESRFGVRRRLRSVVRSSTEADSSVESASSESRLGVRRRVRSVLAKARTRTGIDNSSDEEVRRSSLSLSSTGTGKPLKTTLSALDVVAEAASIGGLGAVVIDEESGAVDVALDYYPISTAASSSKSQVELSTPPPVRDVNGALQGNATGSSVVAAATTSSRSKKKKKSSPASTFSSPLVPPPQPNPEDSFVTSKTKKPSAYTELDAFQGDVSAAFSLPPPPFPFTLPDLSASQKSDLSGGERVEFQADMGREGNGYVVLDVRAPQEIIWDTLLDFQRYPETIPTVRGVTMYTKAHKPDGRIKEVALKKNRKSKTPGWSEDDNNTDKSYTDGTRAVLKHGVASVTRAAFTLSKFRLRIAAMHKYRPHPLGDYMVFTLDPTSSNVVLKSAKGVWHTQSNPDGKGEDYTRVWLLCELKVSPLLPQWITDYAARRAMPRATSWLKPAVEARAERERRQQ